MCRLTKFLDVFIAQMIIVGSCALVITARVHAAPSGTLTDSGNRTVDRPVYVEDFRDISRWNVYKSPGTKVAKITSEVSGPGCPCLRVDYEIPEGGGYVELIRPTSSIPLPKPPSDYMVQFALRGEGQSTGLEFKFSDRSSSNVWWHEYPSMKFETAPKLNLLAREQIQYAWGPDVLKPLDGINGYTFSIVTKTAARGTVWISQFQVLEVPAEKPMNVVHTKNSSYELMQTTYAAPRRMGGLGIVWVDENRTGIAHISFLNKSGQWITVSKFRKEEDCKLSMIPVPNVIDSRAVAVQFVPDALTKDGKGIGAKIPAGESDRKIIAKITPLPPSATVLPANLMVQMASERPKGAFPKYLDKLQSYWTSVPIPLTSNAESGGANESSISDFDIPPVLMNEEGMLEFDNGLFSLEPASTVNGEVRTWGQATMGTTSLVDDRLPMPVSFLSSKELSLTTTAFAKLVDAEQVIYVTYTLQNKTSKDEDIAFNLMIRPIPVTPFWQMENPRDWMKFAFDTISFNRDAVTLGSSQKSYDFHIVPVDAPMGAISLQTFPFTSGPLFDFLSKPITGIDLKHDVSLDSPVARSSGLLQLNLPVKAGQSKDITFAVFRSPKQASEAAYAIAERLRAESPQEAFTQARQQWRKQLNRVQFSAPTLPLEVKHSFDASIGYIIANRKGPALEPGPRRYETSWIRDGSLMADALLQTGQHTLAEQFLLWFSRFQHGDGFVPCCVTNDKEHPLYIEHDSTGQFIFLTAEIFRYTHNQDLLRGLWPKIQMAVAFIRDNREGRGTQGSNVKPDDPTYGLMPKSVSHEGYLGNPVHAYWDDIWTLRGLLDAVYLARVMADSGAEKDWGALASDFRTDLSKSISKVIASKRIDYLPASIEGGEFDPAGTFVGLSLLGMDFLVDRKILIHSFDLYMNKLQKRIEGHSGESNYTAYEMRVIEPLIRMGWADKARTVLDFFIHDQRPNSWHQWPEITWADPSRPTTIGDMPHTWIAAEFIRAVRSLFFTEDSFRRELSIGSGFTVDWFDPSKPVVLRNAPATIGALSFKIQTLSKIQSPTGFTVQAKLNATLTGAEPGHTQLIKVLMPYGCRNLMPEKSADPDPNVLFRTRSTSIEADLNFFCDYAGHPEDED